MVNSPKSLNDVPHFLLEARQYNPGDPARQSVAPPHVQSAGFFAEPSVLVQLTFPHLFAFFQQYFPVLASHIDYTHLQKKKKKKVKK
jgi:hypothetical protein